MHTLVYTDPGLVAGVIKAVADACVEGAVVLELCELGDQMILEETKKVFKKEKEMKKGNKEMCIHFYSTYVSVILFIIKSQRFKYHFF